MPLEPMMVDMEEIVATMLADALAGLGRRLAFEAWADERGR